MKELKNKSKIEQARDIEKALGFPKGSVKPEEIEVDENGVTVFSLPPARPAPFVNQTPIENVRIVVEFCSRHAHSSASNAMDSIRQAVMCRNPSDEPSVFCETSEDGGETWERDDSI